MSIFYQTYPHTRTLSVSFMTLSQFKFTSLAQSRHIIVIYKAPHIWNYMHWFKVFQYSQKMC